MAACLRPACHMPVTCQALPSVTHATHGGRKLGPTEQVSPTGAVGGEELDNWSDAYL